MSLPETTLANPLLDAAYTQFLEMYSQARPVDRSEVGRAVAALLPQGDAPRHDVIQRHTAWVTPFLSELGLTHVEEETGQIYLQEVGALCQEQWGSIQETLKQMSSTPGPPLPSIPLSTLDRDPALVGHFRAALYWLNVVDHIVMGAKQNSWVRWKGGWFSRRLSLIPGAGTYYLLTTDACLMFKDMMYSRFLIHLYCRLDRDRFHLSRKLDEYVEWGKGVLTSLGNQGYEVLKGIEALTQTALIKREEEILDGVGQHKSMLQKYTEKEIKAGGSGAWVQRLEVYLESFSSSRDLAEAFGFLKLWGHPYVDPVGGCVSAKTIAQQDLHLKPGDCARLEWSFCHIYCRGYLKRNGRWPPLTFIPRQDGVPSRLQELYEKSHPALAFGFTQYPASDWMLARFDAHLPFHEGEDILNLVVDRSLSYDRNHLDYTWGSKLPYKPPTPPTSSRVMEELITRPVIDLPAIVEKVSSRQIPREWKIVTVCPKEREMKLEPRMFSMMVLEMRLFFVLTEHNIAEGIFKNLPEQTMTLSRNELLSLFLQSTKPTPGSWVRAVLGIDFSRWNLQWRKETVHPVGRRMDEMYGKPGAFSVVHDFFQESVCLLRLPDYPPDFLDKSNRHNPPEGRTLWYNHKGGFEGIAQKLWTSCTIALIHMSLWHLDLSYRIIGQGDNQVCILDVYVPRTLTPSDVQAHIRSIVSRAAESIATHSLAVGQIVKPEECIYSTCFLTYGKEMILRGAYLPTSLKYISRAFPSTTSDAPSLYEMISSVSSGATGATERNDWSFPTYFLSKMVEGITLEREWKRSLFHGTAFRDELDLLVGPAEIPTTPAERRKRFLALALAIPSNLGGFPITSIPEMLYRGHSDPLSSSLLHLCFLDQIPEVRKYKQVLWQGWLFKPNPDLTGLIQDPYSLPLVNPSPPSSRVASVTSDILPDITNNKQFRELLDRSTPADRDALFSWLGTFEPFYPKMAHDLYKSSLIGVRDAFSRRFTNTRTILALGRQTRVPIIDTSLSADLTLSKRIFSNFSLCFKVGPGVYEFTRSSIFHVASTFRRVWFQGRELEGVTTAHPLSVGTIHWLPSDPKTLPSTNCLVAVAFTTPSHQGLSTRGPKDPYLGSTTSDKAVSKWVRPVDSSPPLIDVVKILTIRNLISTPDSDPWVGLTRLAQSRSVLPVETLEPLVSLRVGGTLYHRYLTRDDAQGSFWNSCFNWPSHLTYSTNLAGDLGAKDYPFDFQEAMLSMASLLCWTHSHVYSPPGWGMCLEVDLADLPEVGDRIVSSNPCTISFPDSAHNYYASVLEVKVSSRAATSARFMEGGLRLPWDPAPSPLTPAVAAIVLQHLRGRTITTTRYGKTIGVPSKRRIIDLPELGLIPTSLMLDGLSSALWMKIGLPLALICSRGPRRPDRVLHNLLDLEVRRGLPGLSGTLQEVDGGNPAFGLGIGLGQENEIEALARWMHLCITRTVSYTVREPFMIYERGNASVSSSLSSYLGVVAARECLSGDPVRLRNGKMMARIVKKCLEQGEEQTRVRLLAVVIRVAHLSTKFRVSTISPEEVLRSLRGSTADPSAYTGGRVRRLYVPPEVEGVSEGGTAHLLLPQVRLPLEVLLDSWFSRPLEIPAPSERWSVLGTLHPQVSRVLLLGVGQGDIGGALPLEWNVTGVERGSSLHHLGHSFTTYHPPGIGPRFSLHPCSWTLSGDVFDPPVRDLLIRELKASLYDLVIIDVEGCDNHQRLKLRHQLAETRVPTYCKVLLDSQDVPLFLQSWAAYRGEGDRLWTTISYPGREFIVGPTSNPVGIHVAVPSHTPAHVECPIPSYQDLAVSLYPPYNPGPDMSLLTGHFPRPTERRITPFQCRALFPFLSPPHRWISLSSSTFRDLCLHLLGVGCPRRRVKALIRLHRASYLCADFLQRVSALALI